MDETSVHPIGETRMMFNLRAKGLYRSCVCRIDGQHRMWISHGDRPDVYLATSDIERIAISALGRVERQTTRLKIGYAHVYGNESIALDAGRDETGRTIERESITAGLPSPMEEGCDTAHAVTTLLDLEPVSIEDPVKNEGIGPPGLLEHQCLIETDSLTSVRELPELFSRRRSVPLRQVEDNEIVAGTVHLGEIDAHTAKDS